MAPLVNMFLCWVSTHSLKASKPGFISSWRRNSFSCGLSPFSLYFRSWAYQFAISPKTYSAAPSHWIYAHSCTYLCDNQIIPGCLSVVDKPTYNPDVMTPAYCLPVGLSVIRLFPTKLPSEQLNFTIKRQVIHKLR